MNRLDTWSEVFVDDGHPEARDYDDNYARAAAMTAEAVRRLRSPAWLPTASHTFASSTATSRWLARLCQRIRSACFAIGSRLRNKPV